MNTNIEKLQSIVANQNKLLEKWLSEISFRVEDLNNKLDEQSKKFSEVMLNAMALQLFHMYTTLYEYALIELHRVGFHFLIVVEDVDSVLLTIVTNTISEDVKKQLEKLKEVLEMTLSKKVVYNVFTLSY